MGYESRIYVVNRNRYREDGVHGLTEVICAFNMGKIDRVLLDCFNKPFDNAMVFLTAKSPLPFMLGLVLTSSTKTLTETFQRNVIWLLFTPNWLNATLSNTTADMIY